MKHCIKFYASFLLIITSCGQDVGTSEDFICDQSVSFSEDIVPIMDTYCAYSGCHFGQFAWGNFKRYEEIKSRTQFIITEVFDFKTMPPQNASGPTELSAIALEKLECWIQNGAPNN